jgi:hypothetical protein
MKRLLFRFGREERGVVFIELAFALVVLMILILGGAEMARYILLQQKLDRVAMSMGDLVSRGQVLTETEVNNIFAAVPHLTAPFEFSEHGSVILTSVHREGSAAPEVIWQRIGAGNLGATSRIGAEGEAPNLPGDFTVSENETIFVAEVFYDFEPFIAPRFVDFKRLYHNSWFRARSIDQSLFD